MNTDSNDANHNESEKSSLWHNAKNSIFNGCVQIPNWRLLRYNDKYSYSKDRGHDLGANVAKLTPSIDQHVQEALEHLSISNVFDHDEVNPGSCHSNITYFNYYSCYYRLELCNKRDQFRMKNSFKIEGIVKERSGVRELAYWRINDSNFQMSASGNNFYVKNTYFSGSRNFCHDHNTPYCEETSCLWNQDMMCLDCYITKGIIIHVMKCAVHNLEDIRNIEIMLDMYCSYLNGTFNQDFGEAYK